MDFTPDYMFKRVVDIPPALLEKNGVKGLLLDVDNTLAADHSPDVAPAVAEWLGSIKAAGIAAAIVSNNGEARVKPFAERLGLGYIAKAKKPSRRSLSRALEVLGCARGELCVVGDQLFTDIWYAKRLGCRSILVEPFSPDLLPFVRFKRRLERPILKRIRQKGEQ